MTARHAKLLTVLAGLIALFDWTLKIYAIERLPPTGSLGGFVDLILHKNPGIAFDIPVPIWVIAPLTVVVCLWLAVFSYTNWSHTKSISTAANIVIIGAAGNLTDRLMHGFTTDYILLFEKTVINLADILIITGIFGLLWYTRNTRTN